MVRTNDQLGRVVPKLTAIDLGNTLFATMPAASDPPGTACAGAGASPCSPGRHEVPQPRSPAACDIRSPSLLRRLFSRAKAVSAAAAGPSTEGALIYAIGDIHGRRAGP